MPEDDNQDQGARYEAACAWNERMFRSKARMRERLAALSFSEKIKILEKLRDRELMIAKARRKLKEVRDTEQKTNL